MITRRFFTCCAWASALLMAGCGGKILYPHYYVLELPPAPAASEASPRLPWTVAVRRFESPPYLRQGRLVYRQAPVEIGHYEYHRWAEDPATMVTSAVMDSLRSSHVFAFVKSYNGQGQEDYVLSGRIEQFEEIDSADGIRVAARLSADLVDLHTGAMVWADEAGEILRVETRNVDSLVVEMSHAVRKSIDRLVASLNKGMPPNSEAKR